MCIIETCINVNLFPVTKKIESSLFSILKYVPPPLDPASHLHILCRYTIYVYSIKDLLGPGGAYFYVGASICNEIVPINQKISYLYALQLQSPKNLLLGYTNAKSQLSSSFPTLHNLLSRRGTKLHCDTKLNSVFKFRILHELSIFSVCLFVW